MSNRIDNMKDLEEIDISYFCEDQTSEIPLKEAKLIYKSAEKPLILTTVVISSEATSGKISLFTLPKKTTIADCTSVKPILVIYLKASMEQTIELDDLYIPIPKENSIYFTSPANTFIGINLEI